MKRVLCIWLPNWRRQRAAIAGERELTDHEALERLVPRCEPFSPTIGVEASSEPECLLLDVTGLAPLFQGETGLVERVLHEFRRFTLRAGLADTLGAAWAVAHYGQNPADDLSWILLPPGHGLAALATLPIEALRLSSDTVRLLHELGLRQIGQVAELAQSNRARSNLAARLAPELLLRLDQAAGEVPETIEVYHPPAEIRAEWTFEPPTDCYEWVEAILDRLIERVIGQLAPCRGVQQLECRLRGQTTYRVQFSVGLFRPSAAPRHLGELVKLQLEKQPLVEPVAALSLWVTIAAPLEERQHELFASGSPHEDPRSLALLIDRLSNRLGREAVARVRLLPEAQPEFAWRYEPAIARSFRRTRNAKNEAKPPSLRKQLSAPSSGLPALSRPLCLFPQPLSLSVVSTVPHQLPAAFFCGGTEQQIERVWGPERIQTGWWRGRTVRRDYYRVETTDGQWFWLFRQRTDGRWFLHGLFV
jgi:protein ImuB